MPFTRRCVHYMVIGDKSPETSNSLYVFVIINLLMVEKVLLRTEEERLRCSQHRLNGIMFK